MTEITEPSYWDEGYKGRQSITPSAAHDNPNFCEEQILRRFRDIGLAGRRVVEIGGGGSALLARLAVDNPDAEFVCLDYSPNGCELITTFASKNNLSNLSAVVSDFRSPPADLGLFDIVFSAGVVEHFTDLAEVLQVFSRYLSQSGQMVTWIPNMSGSIGFLTKRMDREVYEMHVPHDRESFRQGHIDAGLEVKSCDYVGSSSFGVLSSCADPTRPLGWQTYVWLSRASKLGFIIERKFGLLPTTKLFSPYILAISQRPA